jgi:hypothetical protein
MAPVESLERERRTEARSTTPAGVVMPFRLTRY